MYTSNHKVETGFTVYDLNDIISKHQEIILSYDFILQSIETKPLRETFSHLQAKHREDRQKLVDLITQYGGSVEDTADSVAITKKMRLMISTRMSSALDLIHEMEGEETALRDDYIKNINSLTRIENLEPILKSNLQRAEQRLDQMANFMDNNSNL